MGVEEGDVAVLEEALYVRRLVPVRALRSRGMEHALRCLSQFTVQEHSLYCGRA
jgi:hypothetical protein